MNDYYYYTIIKPYIPIQQRAICSKRDAVDFATQRTYSPILRLVLANILLHTGSPCDRYCICKYFDEVDILEYYLRAR